MLSPAWGHEKTRITPPTRSHAAGAHADGGEDQELAERGRYAHGECTAPMLVVAVISGIILPAVVLTTMASTGRPAASTAARKRAGDDHGTRTAVSL